MSVDLTRGGEIALPSIQSLYLRMKFGDTQLASGTGFLVQTGIGAALVTARHNLTGRHHETDACLHAQGGVPDTIEVFHNWLVPGSNVIKSEALFDAAGVARWIEHPRLGPLCDVALLPLQDWAGVAVAPYGRQRDYPQIAVNVAEPVSVVGFPMAQTAGGMMAIWCTGYIASEPMLDYADQPKFLVDCRTRIGQSGSPVIAYRTDTYKRQDGATALGSGQFVRPLGVYTGRIHPDADIGVVWKWSVVEDLMSQFDFRVAREIRQSMMTFGRESSEFAAELKKHNLERLSGPDTGN
jgi:hypothetical protein